jgi:hypothetical protein
MDNFKVGDIVRMKSYCSNCEEGSTYPLHDGDSNGSSKGTLFAWDEKVKGTLASGCSCQDKWVLLPKAENKKPPTANFLLRFDANSHEVEEFETLPSLRARLKELAKDSAINKDSFRVYEVKKTYKVDLGFSVKVTAQK